MLSILFTPHHQCLAPTRCQINICGISLLNNVFLPGQTRTLDFFQSIFKISCPLVAISTTVSVMHLEFWLRKYGNRTHRHNIRKLHSHFQKLSLYQLVCFGGRWEENVVLWRHFFWPGGCSHSLLHGWLPMWAQTRAAPLSRSLSTEHTDFGTLGWKWKVLTSWKGCSWVLVALFGSFQTGFWLFYWERKTSTSAEMKDYAMSQT